MEIRDRKTLKVWDKNYELRRVDEKDFNRMKAQILMGQHSNYLIMADGIIIGGNTRWRAADELEKTDATTYENLKLNEAKCNILSFNQDPERAAQNLPSWYAVLDGVEIKTHYYESVYAGMIAYSLSHNDEVGYYNRDSIANLNSEVNIEWPMFSIHIDSGFNMADMIGKYDSNPAHQEEEEVEEQKPIKHTIVITLEDHESKMELYNRLIGEGYKCALP